MSTEEKKQGDEKILCDIIELSKAFLSAKKMAIAAGMSDYDAIINADSVVFDIIGVSPFSVMKYKPEKPIIDENDLSDEIAYIIECDVRDWYINKYEDIEKYIVLKDNMIVFKTSTIQDILMSKSINNGRRAVCNSLKDLGFESKLLRLGDNSIPTRVWISEA